MSGWTNITLEPKDGDVVVDEEGLVSLDAEEIVEDYIEARCSGDYGPRVHTSSSLTFQPQVRTLDHKEQRNLVEDIAGDCEAVNRVLIIQANDTSDAGKGYLWDTDEGTYGIDLIETIDGYEGAKGRDVVGEFGDEYGISGTASHGW